MSPDGITLNLIVRELQETILQGRVERVYQPEKLEIIILIRSSGHNFRLLLSSRAESARVHLTSQERTNPFTPPLFCSVLRKYLEGSRLISIEQDKGLDRIINFSFSGLGESGDFQEINLISEIMGKHSNLILIDPNTGLIIDGIKRYSHTLSRHREVLPGRPYIDPPQQNRVHPLSLNEERLVKLLLNKPLEKPLEKVFSQTVAGVGPTLAREIIHRAGLDPELRLEFCGNYEFHALWQALHEVIFPLLEGSKPEPTMVFKGNTPVDYALLPLVHYQECKQVKCRSVNEMLDLFSKEQEDLNSFRQLRDHLAAVINQNARRCNRKLSLQKQDQAEAKAAQKFRLEGEMLFAHLHMIKPGTEEIVLPNLYDPDAPHLRISLDPALTAVQNAQQLLRKYDKARDSLKILKKQIKNTEEEIQYLNSIRISLEHAENLADLLEIRSELEDSGYLSRKEKKHNKKAKKKRSLQVRRFTSQDGFQILVGKNNKQNDYLTMHLASDEDYWLHIKDSAGAHVVIKSKPGQKVPPSTLEEAAELAAYYSTARLSSKVPVDCTKRKNVSKPSGARPGFVIYKNYQTFFVTPKIPEEDKTTNSSP
jgi:predicted ribosome quality control (RQC) complex YloA/Tae2 family protein